EADAAVGGQSRLDQQRTLALGERHVAAARLRFDAEAALRLRGAQRDPGGTAPGPGFPPPADAVALRGQKILEFRRAKADDLADAEAVVDQQCLALHARGLLVGAAPNFLVDEGIAERLLDEQHVDEYAVGPQGEPRHAQPVEPAG